MTYHDYTISTYLNAARSARSLAHKCREMAKTYPKYEAEQLLESARHFDRARWYLSRVRMHRYPIWESNEMSEWQPIETVPKGLNNEVLTYRSSGLMAVAVNVDNVWIVSDGCEIVHITHWMPLPEPPK